MNKWFNDDELANLINMRINDVDLLEALIESLPYRNSIKDYIARIISLEAWNLMIMNGKIK